MRQMHMQALRYTEAQHWLKLQRSSHSIFHPPPSLVLCSLAHSLTVSRLLNEVFLGAQAGAVRNFSETLPCVCSYIHSSPFLLSGSFCLDTGALSLRGSEAVDLLGSELDHGPGRRRSRGRSRKLGHWQTLLTDACLDLKEWGAPPARLCLMGCALS